MTDAIATLQRDHAHTQDALTALDRTTLGDGTRERIAHRLAALYALHSAVEAEHVYPLIRERAGDRIADVRLAKRRAFECTLKVLDSVRPGDPRFDLALWTARAQAFRDLDDERRLALPQLAAVCTDRELAILGRQIRESRRLAPMRPHPSAPDTPPLNRVINPALGALDRLLRNVRRGWRVLTS